MTTSGTTAFNLDINDIAEEAFERCGQEMRSGYDLRTARRSLNLLTIEWSNRGINLWTIEQGSIDLEAGTATYNLPLDTIDLLDQVIRTGSGATQADLTITRISETVYSTIPTKNALGRPIQMWVNRRSGASYPTTGAANAQVVLWPVPDQSDFYTLVYWRLRRIQDAGSGAIDQDIPFRFLNAMVAGLAYYLSIKLPDVPPERIAMLKADYEQQFQFASEEDREKTTLRVVPRIIR